MILFYLIHMPVLQYYLYHNKNILKKLSNNCKQRQEELSWDNKAQQMIKLYNKVLNGNN